MRLTAVCLAALLALISCSTVSCQATKGAPSAPFAPKSGGWFGVTVDYLNVKLDDYISQADIAPVAFNVFVTLPLDANSTERLVVALPQLAEMKALVVLTVEPTQGLSAVTYAEIGKLGYYIMQAQLGGASFMVSFGHEMNGNWYTWGQQPAAYVDAFQKVRRTLNSATCGVAMIWSPNPARGYPWRGPSGASTFGSKPGTPDWATMDTNGDGQVTSADDPLMPYWPGDENVSWIGTAAYSWGGGEAPFTKNALPAAQQFSTMVTGYGSPQSNVYQRFCIDGVHNKPMVVTETSALYIPSNPVGNTDMQIKSAWWQQVFNANGDTPNSLNLQEHFGQIKMIMWFDVSKPENSAGGNIVDWQFSKDPEIKDAFVSYVSSQYAANGAHYWGDLSAFRKSGLASSCRAPASG